MLGRNSPPPGGELVHIGILLVVGSGRYRVSLQVTLLPIQDLAH